MGEASFEPGICFNRDGMCGIGGVVVSSPAQLRPTVEHMLSHLRHRGPDDAGIHIDESGVAALCAARLAIRDLSPRGHQPMAGPNGDVIAFNGELYNADKLRRELRSAGRAFVGGADTEVALAAYERWGEDAWVRLRGMFAIAVWDSRAQTLVLVRDPLGVKPLYVSHDDGRLVFASELRALLRGRLRPPALSRDALCTFLATGAVEEPRAIVDGVRMLAPGAALRLKDDTVRESVFWSVESAFARRARASRADVVVELRERLEAAVRRQLVSDTPLGVFLSGGIDSSTLVGLASTVADTPRTVSVVFGEERYSEAPYIEAVRRRWSTVHHEVQVTADDFLARLPAALRAMDQPTVDGVNTFVVSELARRSGLTVALSGLGGDELFAGYELFRTGPRLERLRDRLPQLPSRAAALGGRLAYGRSDRGRKLGGWLAGEHSSAYVLQRELFDASTREALLGASPEAGAYRAPRALDVNAISKLELTCYMRNMLLRDADVMSMSHGLEVRVPFLDQDVVELVAGVGSEHKVADGRHKALLVDAVADLLPDPIVNREKMGFTLPFEKWLRGTLRDEVRDRLLEPSCGGEIGAALRPKAVAEVWKRFERGDTSWTRPWALYTAKVWGERHLGDSAECAAAA
jgi:asparagine synthase (glutamine-hydrolysing)